MSVAACAEQIRIVLTEGAAQVTVQEVIANIEKLSLGERLELVLSNAWGTLLLGRLPDDDIFRLLRVLGDARPPPTIRDQFYASFDCQGLCEACVEQLRVSSRGENAMDIRLCIRNLARNPTFRLRLSGAVSILASSLKDEEVRSKAHLERAGASAAALCNICCDNTFKMEAVRLGVVPSLLQNLEKSPTNTTAEDLVACLGVLTAGYPPGMEALFGSGKAPVLLACLCNSDHIPLQVLAIEVISDLCSCSKSFIGWLVDDTDLLKEHVGRFMSLDGDPELLSATLKLCNRLADNDAFAKNIQKGDAVQALQKIAELPREANDLNNLDERRPPTKQEEALALMGKILNF